MDQCLLPCTDIHKFFLNPSKKDFFFFFQQVWSKRPAQDWYSGSVWPPVDQLQKTAFFPDEAQIITAMKDESKINVGALQTSIASQAGVSSSEALKHGSFGQYNPVFQTVQGLQSQNIVPWVQATSTQDVPAPELQNGHGTQSSRQSNSLSSVRVTSGNAVPSLLYWKRPTVYGLSQGLSQKYGGGQSSSAYIMTQQASESAVSSGGSSTSSSYSGSQSQGSTSYGLSQWLASRYGNFPTQQGTTWLSSAPALSMHQQAIEGATTGNGSSGLSGSYTASQSRSSTGYGLFQGLSSPYGFPTQQGTSQVSSAPAVTLIQQATEGAIMGNGSSSLPGLHIGSQSQSLTANWLSLRPLSRSVGSQAQQSVNQLSSVPRLTVTQQAPESVVSNGGSQSQGSTCYRLSQWITSCYGNFQTWQGINQLGSVPGLTVRQQTS